MKIPTIQEIGQKLDLKRQKKESASGGGLTHIDEEDINSLHSLAKLSELEEVKEGTRTVTRELKEAQDRLSKMLADRSRN